MDVNERKLIQYVNAGNIYTDDYRLFEMISVLESQKRHSRPGLLWDDVNPDYKDQMGLPATDVGIDYLIQFNEKKLIVGQSKCYSTGYVAASDMDRTRLCAHVICANNIDARTVEFSTTNIKLGNPKIPFPKLNDINQNSSNIKYTHQIITEPTIEEWIDWALVQDIPVNQDVPIILRPCQTQAMEIIDKKKSETRIKMCCGSGKSRVMLETIYKEKGMHCILVPSLLLLHQFMETLRKDGDAKRFSGIAIPIGTGHTAKRPNMVGCETIIVVCVYNSFDHIKDLNFECYWIDEAHHLKAGDSYIQEILNTIKERRSVWFSATLKRPDYEYTMRQGIEDGILCDYDVRVPLVLTTSDVSVESSIDSTLIEYFLRHSFNSILVYFNKINEAENFAKLCIKAGIKAASISCEETSTNRKIILDKFKQGKIRILASVNTLGEGIDITIADCCCIARPRNSEIFLIQAIGRAMRLHPAKTISHIVIPMCLDSTQTLVDQISSDKTIKIFARLARNDSRLLESIKSRKSRLSIDSTINPASELIPIDQVHEYIMDRTCEIAFRNAWEYRFELFRKYYSEFGKLPVNSTIIEKISLGNWLQKQKMKYKQGKLHITKITALDSVDINWKDVLKKVSEGAKTFDWTIKIICLKKFIDDFKKLPKQSSVMEITIKEVSDKPISFNIGRWVCKLRQQFKDNDPKLTKENIMELNIINPQLLQTKKVVSDFAKLDWNIKIQRLKEFVGNTGKLPTRNEKPFGKWLSSLKEQYNNGSFSDQSKITDLDMVVPTWRNKQKSISEGANIPWDKKILLFADYMSNHTELPAKNMLHQNFNIKRWIEGLRRSLANGTLNQQIQDELDAISKLWRPKIIS